MPDTDIVRLVVVEGFVQGVGYREFTRHTALTHGVAGWVRNRSDRTVEALLVGAEPDVEALVQAMRRGPRSASVTGLRVSEGGAARFVREETFEIRPTL